MSLFNGDYLRVRTPLTINGVTPKMHNGRQMYREDHLPLSARKHLEKKNLKLPDHLKKIIEVVTTELPEEVQITAKQAKSK